MHPAQPRRIQFSRASVLLVLVAVGAIGIGGGAFAFSASTGATAGMADAATSWLAALRPEQTKRAALAWDDAERLQWHFVPKARAGLALKDMDPAQRRLATALLRTGLGQKGVAKTLQIMELETVLAAIEKDPVKRDAENYHYWVFGTPSAKGTWAWKFEGHHLSLNFTVVKGTFLATTPLFMGANPGEVRSGPLSGRRVLAAEEDMGRTLLQSFDDVARARAVFDGVAPAEIVTGAASKIDPLAPAGAAAAGFTARQKELLRALLLEYAAAMPPAVAADRMARLDAAGFGKIHFAWAGGAAKGQPHYYRIQGPTFLVEYDNTQNGANHVHTVWRDFDGDFGRDLLRDHLKAAAH